jgi:hypothetical protein
MISICAKLGGIPWTIQSMPFSEMPTMILSVDMKKTQFNNQRLITFAASKEVNFASYILRSFILYPKY